MRKIASLIACFSLAAFAQTEQQPQPQQQQYYYPPQQQQYQYPPQEQYQYPPQPQQQPQQQQYQYPPQQQQTYQPQQAYQLPQIDNKEQLARVRYLIKDGLEKNKEEIQKISLDLSFTDKETLYKRNRYKLAVVWSALNFSTALGLGSYIQGDIGAGIAQSVLEAIGVPCFIIGAGASFTDSRIVWGTLVVVGIGSVVTSRVIGLVSPFSYQKKHNKELESALNINNVSYSIDPLIVPKDGVPAVGVAFNLRY